MLVFHAVQCSCRQENRRKMFRSICIITILPCVVLNLAVSIPSNADEKKDRSIHKDLSDKEHYGNAGEHNSDYDHEAFLGEQAKDFDNLTPEESIRRLGVIVDKMDKDNDGSITLEELKEWILYTQNRYLVNDIESQWRNYDKGSNGTLKWENYRLTIYGIRSEQEVGELESQQGFSYKKMLARDKRRWKMADNDNDGELSRDEFAAFLHPENVDHMRDVVILETMEDIDKDSDGKITLEEYISDVYSSGVSPDDEPDWVQTEREQFKLYRDKNGDGVMDEEEVRDWLLPPDFDHAESEARHLLYEADSDSDEKLTKEEILEKYDIFVGSQATDFGEALTRHDEF